MSQYVYSKLAGHGWFRPDHICRDQYYKECQYCNSKDHIVAYYGLEDWTYFSQRHILISHYVHVDKMSRNEAESLVHPDYKYYHFRFYCDHCMPQYQKHPIRCATSVDDEGESALDQAMEYWNKREFDQDKLHYWES